MLFENILGVKFIKVRPRWLRSSRGTLLELDGFNHDLMLAFEFQGFQHYQKTWWHESDEDFSWQLQRDQEKRDLCKANGVHLIEVPEHEYTPSFVKDAIEQWKLTAALGLLPVIPLDVSTTLMAVDG